MNLVCETEEFIRNYLLMNETATGFQTGVSRVRHPISPWSHSDWTNKLDVRNASGMNRLPSYSSFSPSF